MKKLLELFNNLADSDSDQNEGNVDISVLIENVTILSPKKVVLKYSDLENDFKLVLLSEIHENENLYK